MHLRWGDRLYHCPKNNQLIPHMKSAQDRWSRIYITSVEPRVHNGSWPIKRAIGQPVHVRAGAIVDGHDRMCAQLRITQIGGATEELMLTPSGNDEYTATFVPDSPGRYAYQVRAWVDRYGSWQHQFNRRREGGAPEEELQVELLDGAAILESYAANAPLAELTQIMAFVEAYRSGNVEAALDPKTMALVRRHDPQLGAVESEAIAVEVDHPLAACAAWYEFFPRSAADKDGQHATLDDAARRLPGIRDMGFDIVYLPPIHPIGYQFRKGKDNHPTARPDEPGSPWAIGTEGGGHTSVHEDLGGMEALDRFVATADKLGLRVALDIALQCSPDHPWVTSNPQWFRKRADGTIRYAENPPKKYQDVYPFDFECKDWRALWEALKNVFEFWMGRGINIFRVDNPHTKPLAFWEWCLARLKALDPNAIFLAEAFTRPKTMYTLAKLGFNNSYTYFTWRNTKDEIVNYVRELTRTNVVEYFRPNFWPNTPDILHEYLATGGRPAHISRFVLAATLSPVYGVYGPPYEHIVCVQHPDREEYADNEKYEIRNWNWNDPHSLQPLFARVNRIRRENPALQQLREIHFLNTRNPNLIAYYKVADANLVLCVVTLDPYQEQKGTLTLPLEAMGLADHTPFQLDDLLGGNNYIWQGRKHTIRLDPKVMPAQLYRVRKRMRTEADFDYYN